ncbi:iron ABC transporter permease [[Clostridium] innocuum]|nr:iron ABC transporter permease [Erysipelotrichaceae bacterium]MCR0383353.1 iron ABC transporter permease [[Clostridium] innocuum]MCR0412746.1 iron ABC transporter permease [[Clostridium] innocuum]MCR0536295.1 iron ABC transporter permease [[Clostridium] innocuum]MCR0540322.1 iron ABC transporter permease [[Clostridium] innocuum]
MRSRVSITAAIGILLLLQGIVLSVLIGAKDIPFDDVLHALFEYQGTLHDQLIRNVRLPRALSALLCGGLLAASGVMMQGILRNPIAEPSILGITQGSVLFVACASVFPLLAAVGNFWMALLGAGCSGLVLFLFAVKNAGRQDVSRILLAGTAFSMFFLSTASLTALVQNRSQELAFWIAGGFRQADWGAVIGLGVVTLFCMSVFLRLSGRVNLLSLGDEAAISLGVDAAGLKKQVILAMIPLCAMCVAVAGNIGFVGLFVPHILRRVLSRDIRYLLPLSFLYGGVMLVFADIAARTLSAPYELPVGLFTAILGIPVFLLLVRKEGG